MNFLMNLVAALWVGFSVVAGEGAFSAAIALLCCLVILVNERNAPQPQQRSEYV